MRKSAALICFSSSSSKGFSLPFHYYRLDREFMRRQTHRLKRGCPVNAFHLEQDTPRTHHRGPSLGTPFALAHPGFSGFFGKGFVGKNTNPYTATTLDMAGKR